jgi:hypothetical protein
MPRKSRNPRTGGNIPVYKILDWVLESKDRLDWSEICKQPEALQLAATYDEYIDCVGLAGNPHPYAMTMFLYYQDRIPWTNLDYVMKMVMNLSNNHNQLAIDFLVSKYRETHLRLDDFLQGNRDEYPILENLFSNPYAVDILQILLPLIPADILESTSAYASILVKNQNPRILEMLMAMNNREALEYISYSPFAIDYLRANRQLINWKQLCSNQSYEAMDLLLENLQSESITVNDMDIRELCGNPAAIDLIATYTELYGWRHVNIYQLCNNPNVHGIQFVLWSLQNGEINWSYLLQENIATVFHKPKHMHEISELWDDLMKNYKSIEWSRISGNGKHMLKYVLHRMLIESRTPFALMEKPVVEVNPVFLNLKYHTVMRRVGNKTDEEYLIKDIIDWKLLSEDSSMNAIKIMRRYPELIIPESFCNNKNPQILTLISVEGFTVAKCMSKNPHLIDYFRTHPRDINWKNISQNPAIFEIDRNAMTQNMRQSSRQSGHLDAIASKGREQRIKIDAQFYSPSNMDAFVHKFQTIHDYRDSTHLLFRKKHKWTGWSYKDGRKIDKSKKKSPSIRDLWSGDRITSAKSAPEASLYVNRSSRASLLAHKSAPQ